MRNKRIFLLIVLAISSTSIFAQNNSNTASTVFETIANKVKNYKIDTSAVPDDKITKKIIELRKVKGGFNIDEAIAFKIGEEKSKGEVPAEELKKLADYFTTGEGHRLLTNAVTWIYREQFSYEELKTLVKFYKTNAGQKMATQFPLIMLKSFAASEIIKAGMSK